MRARLPRTTLAPLALAVLLATGSAAQVPDYIRDAPESDEYPNQDGLVLRHTIRITLGSDGRVERHVERSLKMLASYVTRTGDLDPSIDWNEVRASLRIDQARTYMRDGTIVDAKENSKVLNTASAFAWAVPYAHMRRMTVPQVGVEHGATSVLEYTVRDREPAGVPLWEVVELQTYLPILDQRIIVQVPAGTELHFAGIGCQPEVSVEESDGLTSYEFRRADVPPANLAEAGSGHHGLQKLVFTTSPDWTAARGFFEERLAEALAPDSTVQARAEKLIEDTTLPREKIAKIHEFVVDGIRTIHWPLDAFDYVVRPAGRVLESSVGHSLDKAALLAALLRAAGFHASVALVDGDARSGRVADVAAPSQLEQAWVRVETAGGTDWLDPAAKADAHNVHHLAGKAVLVMDGGRHGLETLPDRSAQENGATLHAEVEVEDGGHELKLSGTADVDLVSFYNPLAGYDRSSNRQEKVAGAVAAAWGDAEVDEVYVAMQSESLTSLRTTFSGGSIEVPRHGLVRLTLPRVPGAVTAAALQTHRGSRTLPLVLPKGPASETVQVELTLPDGYELAYRPEAAAVANSVGSVHRTVETEEGTVSIRTKLTLEKGEVPAEDYPDLRALMTAVTGESKTTILLQRED
jgi:hypothetical protein